MRRRLQHPLDVGPVVLTEPLELAPVPGVRGAQVGADEPPVVRGDVVHPRPVLGRELVRGEEDALGRQRAAVLVHRQVLGGDAVPEADLAVDPLDARRVGGARGRGHRVEHLPGARNPRAGVEREELVEDRRARAGGATDDPRCGHREVGRRAGGHDAEPVHERAQQLGTRQCGAHRVQVGLLGQRRAEQLEANAPRVPAEVGGAGDPRGGRDQLGGFDGVERERTDGPAAHDLVVDPVGARRWPPAAHRWNRRAMPARRARICAARASEVTVTRSGQGAPVGTSRTVGTTSRVAPMIR